MADVPLNYTLRVGTNNYPVSRKGTECTIDVGDNFFSPKKRINGKNEARSTWVKRVSDALYFDLNKISRVRSASFAIPIKVIIKMDQPNSWGNIEGAVREAFRAHLQRKANGEYGS